MPFGENTVEQAKAIVGAQIAPATEPLVSAIPTGTTLRALFITRGGEAYVDSERRARHRPSRRFDQRAADDSHAGRRADRQPAGDHRRPAARRRQGARHPRRPRRPPASVHAESAIDFEWVHPAPSTWHPAFFMHSDSRPPNKLRDTTLTPNYLPHAEGSVFIEAGTTKVICTASVEDRVPPFLRNTGKGWVTAEYGMLPRATSTRTDARGGAGQGRRPHAGDPAADRPLAPLGHQAARRSASGRSGSTATSSRPTAARARRRSPAPSSRWHSPARGCASATCSG